MLPALLAPSIVLRLERASISNGAHAAAAVIDILLRDALVLTVAVFLAQSGFRVPRSVFVALAYFAVAADVVNQLTLRMLPPNPRYKREWTELQGRQTRAEIVRLLELRALHRSLPEFAGGPVGLLQ